MRRAARAACINESDVGGREEEGAERLVVVKAGDQIVVSQRAVQERVWVGAQ